MAQNDEVKLHFLDYWRVIRVHWVLVLLAFFLVLITAAIVSYFQPREYQSSAFIEVKSMAQNPRIFGTGDPNLPIHDPQLAPTVFQVIQRTGILYPVIDQLKLQDKWTREGVRPSREQAYAMLRSKLDVDEVRNTDLLQISVFDTDPQLAADIANKIVAVYQDTRVDEEKEILNRAVSAMNEEVSKQQKRVDEAADGNGSDPGGGTYRRSQPGGHRRHPGADQQSGDQAGGGGQRRRDAWWPPSNRSWSRSRSSRVTISMRMLATLNIQDPTMQKVLPNYQDAVAQEALLLNSGFGENHPKVKAIHATEQVYAQPAGTTDQQHPRRLGEKS